MSIVEEYLTRGEMMAAAVEPRGVGAEIGVLVGMHASELLGVCAPRKLYLVDPFERSIADPIWDDYEARVRSRFRHRGRVVEIVRSRGAEWLALREPNSLDWVYIDASHEYEDTREELAAAVVAVREGGVIAGHDLVVDTGALWHSGVVRAVGELLSSGAARMVGVTREKYPSWATIVNPKTKEQR